MARVLGLTLPVNPIAVAESKDILVVAKPAEEAGVSGMLIRRGNDFAIAYATHIDNEGFKRFSVAHELGHLQLEGHIDAVVGSSDIHQSRAGFASKDQYEVEADGFAAGFLMPRFLFFPELEKAGEGIAAIERLSNICETSLHATAIRYAQCTREAVAIIVSTGKQIEHCFMSESVKSTRGIEWIKKRDFLPQNSVTFAFNNDSQNVRSTKKRIGQSSFQDWFGGQNRSSLSEEVVGLGSYGKSLTILFDIKLPDPEEEDEEARLIESWIPRFRK